MKKRYIALALAGALAAALFKPGLASQGSGCMPTTGTVSGLTFAQNVNSAIDALTSMFSGASPPATACSGAAVKGQQWLDTSVTPNVVRQYEGTSWVALGALDATNHLWAPPVGGGVASITAASTTDICAAPSAYQTISGITPITSFGSNSNCVLGARKTIIFNSATPITYNATSLILPGQRSYTTAPGDMADLIYLGSGNWRVKDISKIDGTNVTNAAVALGTIQYGIYGTVPANSVYGMGQALVRSAVPDYFLAATRAQLGTLTAGNDTINSVADTSGLGAGMPIEGVGIQPGTVITSVNATQINMSTTATVNGSQTVRVIIPGYGSGGDSTTIGVPDCKGRTVAGRDNMGGPSAGRLTSTYFGLGSRINAAGGLEYNDKILSHSHGVWLRDPGHNHRVPVIGATASAYPVDQFSGTSQSPQASGYQSTIDGTNITIGDTSSGPFANQNRTAVTGSVSTHSVVMPTVIAECVVVVRL